jgi:hypothetical protein
MSSGIPQGNTRGVVPLSAPLDLSNQFVCPYCGFINDIAEGNCPRCTMENSPAGRKATKARIGPWYVLQKRNPAAPGMKYETLLSFVHRGRVKAHSIVRGPTTHQLWRFAAQVRGLSREFGLCYSCGSVLVTDAAVCPQCNRPQSLPAQPDAFLESADGEPTDAVVYRTLPADVAPANGNGNGSAPDPPQAPSPNPPSEFTIDEISAAPVDTAAVSPALQEPKLLEKVAEPPVDTNRDMIIPSLPEDTPVQRPTTARERLAQARRQLVFDPVVPDSNDLDDDAFDDGPPRPPRMVGPAFSPGPRPPGPPRARHKWIEGVILILVLLGAVGSGLVYVDPHLQALAQGWETAGMKALGIHTDSKPSDLKINQPEVNPVQPWQPPAPIFSSTDNATGSTRVSVTPPPVFAPSAHPAPVFPLANTKLTAPSNPVPQPSPAPVVADTSHTPAPAPTPAPEPAPAPVADSPADATPPPDAPDDDPFAKARTLRRRAIDAENAGDYATAVSLFEQIKDLPREAWPGDLELRLRAAKANADGKPLH